MPPYDPSYRLPAYQPREDRSDYRLPGSRSRSPPPRHNGDPRERARSSSPYRRAELPRQSNSRPSKPARRPVRSARNPQGIFKDLKYYCFSTEFDNRAVQMFCSRMKHEGAKGVPEMYMAEVIVVLVAESKEYKSIEWTVNAPPCGREHSLTLEGVYHSYATRVHPDRDPQRLERKRVVQSNWVELCLEKQRNREPGVVLREEWEVMVDNLAQPLEVIRANAMEDVRPDTPPLPDDLLPEMMTQALPSFEYRQNEPVRSAARDLPEARPLVRFAEPEIPTVASAPYQMSRTQRIATNQGWTDSINSAPVPKAPALVPALSTSASITPAKLPVKVSVDPRLQLPARPLATASRPLATPSPHPPLAPVLSSSVAPIPITIQQDAESTSQPSSSPPQTSAPDLSNTAEAAQKIPEVSPISTTTHSHPARTGAKGVFARGQDMPWLFHVYGDDKTGITAMMIEELGGGQIAPLHLASTIVIPESGVREAQTEEIRGIVKSVGFGREVVSIDWVSRCIKNDRLVDYDTYRITLPSIQTPIETQMDVEMTVEEAPAPAPAPTLEMEVDVASAPASPVIEAELPPASPSDIGSPCERPFSPKPRKRNATAGPSGTRHSTPPRRIEIIMIDDEDSDDDFIMLETPPMIFKKSATPDTKRKLSHVEDRYPTPPMTPLAVKDDRSRSPDQGASDTVMTPIAAADGSSEYDPEDDIPLKRPCDRNPPIEVPSAELWLDPFVKEMLIQRGVPKDLQEHFRMMERELHEWAKEDFDGTLLSFYARITVKYPNHGNWQKHYEKYCTLLYGFVAGLGEKGNVSLRGPKDRVAIPAPGPSTV